MGAHNKDEILLRRMEKLSGAELQELVRVAIEYGDHPTVNGSGVINKMRKRFDFAINELGY